MQFLKIRNDTTLSELGQLVGSRNVTSMLVQNQLTRSVDIGQQYNHKCKDIMNTAPTVSWQDKQVILNKFVSDYNVFEEAALLGESGWKVLKNLDAFPNAMRVPETITLPDSSEILSGGGPVSRSTYNAVMSQLADPSRNNQIDSAIFNDYNAMLPAIPFGSNDASGGTSSGGGGDVFQWFHIPWGQVTLVNLLTQDAVDFPVYPEELSDKRSANYSTMPDLLYQYEPWQVYDSSGPRNVTYSFDMHRQMWTGNEGDGKANDLIRFCQSFLYPIYSGSAVNTANATLYVAGSPLISGIINDVVVDWDGPISSIDNWYLHFKIDISFIEVATQALNHDVVRNLPLIG